jgi:hypothetical protein
MAARLSVLRADRRFTPQEHYSSAFGTNFCWRLNEPQGLVRPKWLAKLIKIIHIGFRTRDLNHYSWVSINVLGQVATGKLKT